MINTYRHSDLNLSDEQVDAAIGIVCDRYSVLTGGSGTGKSSTLKAIVYILKEMVLTFSLVAPTAMAAGRMEKLTGEKAQTIHRFLGCRSVVTRDEPSGRREKNKTFQYNEKNRLDTDFIIIDEASMLNISLTAALLKVVPTAQVLFVGDKNQLPAIGPGNILQDIIDSKVINVYRLTQIFRQAEGSLILKYANQIKSGFPVKMILSDIVNSESNDNERDCFFFFSEIYRRRPTEEEGNNNQSRENAIKNFIEKCPFTFEEIERKHDKSKPDLDFKEFTKGLLPFLCQSLKSSPDSLEIQVLTTMNKGSFGTRTLNNKIQKVINPYTEHKRQININGKTYRVGDRVIHIKNNYKLGVYNGNIGIIKNIDNKNFTCTVEFPEGKLVKYGHKDLQELRLAYATTVHKFQGNESDVVLLLCFNGDRMLTRNLIYTAMTRAKKLLVVVGDMEAFAKAVDNKYQLKRQTALKELLISS